MNNQHHDLDTQFSFFFVFFCTVYHDPIFEQIIGLHDIFSRCHLVIDTVMIEIQTDTKPYSYRIWTSNIV